MAEQTAEKLDGLGRSAVLLLAVGQDHAAQILKHMNPREVQQLGTAVTSLSNVNSDTVNAVLHNFYDTIQSQTALGMDTGEFVRGALTKALGEDRANTVLDRMVAGTDSQGLELLKWMDARSIADLVRQEHPQIVAIIFSLLDSDQASAVFEYLPEKVRADVVLRIASLEGIQPAALKELDSIMSQQLTGSSQSKQSALGGIEAAANIMNLLDGSTEAAIMEQIMEIDPTVGEKIQDKMFVFEDLADVDDRGIQTLLREISTDTLLLALKGADEALKEKIFRNMSKRAAEMLREDMQVAPPAKLSDVEGAQKEILGVARRLSESGEINLAGGGGDVFL
ncbi:MAG TPA: flagellar motor switch protein FliG [Methylococcaceae bacterium]|nr:flagellar motor switch protein FliG [Methylococcaceae bacterium]